MAAAAGSLVGCAGHPAELASSVLVSSPGRRDWHERCHATAEATKAVALGVEKTVALCPFFPCWAALD